MSGSGQGGGGGFWGMWDKVKETSTQVISVYKEDLQEFTSALTADTKHAIVQSAEIVKKATEDISHEELESGEEEGPQSGPRRTGDASSGLSALTSKLKQGLDSFLSEYPATDPADAIPAEELVFLEDPLETEAFQKFLEAFDLQQKTDEVSHLLTTDDFMRQAHAQYVPAKVGYGTFWKRYFFQQHKLRETENRRALLLEKATAAIEEEEDLGWGDDDDSEAEEEVIDVAPARKESHPSEEAVALVPVVTPAVAALSELSPVPASVAVVPAFSSPAPVEERDGGEALLEPTASPSLDTKAEPTSPLPIASEPPVSEQKASITPTADLLDLSGPSTPSSPSLEPKEGILSPQPSPVATTGLLTPTRGPSPLEKSPTVAFDDLSGSGGSSNSLLGDDWEVVPEKATPSPAADDLDDAWADWE